MGKWEGELEVKKDDEKRFFKNSI